jgi:hypothetical protein
MAGSCQGASSFVARGTAGLLSPRTTPASPAESAVAPLASGATSAARNPESQARCSALKGAFSGMKKEIGGG